MGRKYKNKVTIEENIEKEESDDEENDLTLKTEEKEYNEFSIKWDLKNELSEYCLNNSLPLCQYLTYESLDDFVKYLKE